MEQTQPFSIQSRRPMSATGMLNQRSQDLLSENTYKSPQIEFKDQSMSNSLNPFQKRPISAAGFNQDNSSQQFLFKPESRPGSAYQKSVSDAKSRLFKNISLKAHPNEIISAYEQLLSKENKKRGVKYDLDIVNSMAHEIQCLRKEKHELENQLRLQKANTGKKEAEARSLRRQIDQFAHRPQISLDSTSGSLDIVALSKKDIAPTYEYVKSLKQQLAQLQEANRQYEEYIEQIMQSTKVQRISELEKHLNIYYEKFNGLQALAKEQGQQIQYLTSLTEQYKDEIRSLKGRLQAATAIQRIAVPASPPRPPPHQIHQHTNQHDSALHQDTEQSLHTLQQNLQNSMTNTQITTSQQKSSFIDASMASNAEDDQFDFGPVNLKNISDNKKIAFQTIQEQINISIPPKKEQFQPVIQPNPTAQSTKQTFKSYQIVASSIQPSGKAEVVETDGKNDDDIYNSANFHQILNKENNQDSYKSPREQNLPPKAYKSSKLTQQSSIRTLQSYSALDMELDEDGQVSMEIGSVTKASMLSDYPEQVQSGKKSILSKAGDEKHSSDVARESFGNKSPQIRTSEQESPGNPGASMQSFQSVQIHDDMFDSAIGSQHTSLSSVDAKNLALKLQAEQPNEPSSHQSQIYTSVKVTDDMFD